MPGLEGWMALQLRVLTTLSLRLGFRFHYTCQTCHVGNARSKRYDTIFWPLWAYTYTYKAYT